MKTRAPKQSSPASLDVSASKEGSSVVCVKASDITPTPFNWIWPDWLAAGKINLLAGAPGSGKTTIAIDIAARVSVGVDWPDGTENRQRSVLLWSGEDGLSDTLVPRLIAAGADRERVQFISTTEGGGIKRPFDPGRDLNLLLSAVNDIGDVGLVILDPVVQAVLGDSHKSADVRRALQPLFDLGSQTGAAVLGITHFSKGTAGLDVLERVTGSVAFGAFPRVVLVAAKEHGGEGSRVLARAKSNNGPDIEGLSYRIEATTLESYEDIIGSRVVWGEPRSGSANDIIDFATGGVSGLRSEVADWLMNQLRDGPVLSRTLLENGRLAHYSSSAIDRARRHPDIRKAKTGYGAQARSYVYLAKHQDKMQQLRVAADSLNADPDPVGPEDPEDPKDPKDPKDPHV